MGEAEQNEEYAQIALLVMEGFRKQEVFHKWLKDNPVNPAALWTPRTIFLAFLCYATGMAKVSDLDRDGFMKLCGGFYDFIEVAKEEMQQTLKASQ